MSQSGASLVGVDTTGAGAISLLGNNSGETNSWGTTTSLGESLSATEVVFANGYAYQIGGWNGSAPDADVRYARVNSDGTLDSWSDTTDLPEGRSNHEALIL